MAYKIEREQLADLAGVTDLRKQAARVQAGVLKAALADVIGVVAGRNTVPVLDNVLIEAGDGQLALSATNLDMWARRTLASNDRDGAASADWVQSIRPFAITAPAKTLASVLGALDGEAMVTLTCATASGYLSAGEAGEGPVFLWVSAGRSRYKLHTLPVADFPVPAPMAVEHAFEIGCSALADAFARVEMAISTEETRYYLNGIYIHVAQELGEPQWLVLATADGHRLARLRCPVPDGAASWPAAILPRQAVALLDKLLKVAAKSEEKDKEPPKVLVEASAGGTALRFAMPASDGGDIEVQTKVIDGTFPDYLRVIPTAPEQSLLVQRAVLLAAIKRVSVLTMASSRAVRAQLARDMIELVVMTPELGEAREEVPCAYEGPDMTIGFNGQYWREALEALACDEVALSFTDPGAPLLVRATGSDVDPQVLVQVLMPMRV